MSVYEPRPGSLRAVVLARVLASRSPILSSALAEEIREERILVSNALAVLAKRGRIVGIGDRSGQYASPEVAASLKFDRVPGPWRGRKCHDTMIARALRYVERSGHEVTANDVAKAIRIDAIQAADGLGVLARSGRIARLRRGVYAKIQKSA